MTALVDARSARRRTEVRGGGRLGLLQLRQLHGDLPALRQRRDLPAATDPLRPGGHEGRPALQQGAVDLLLLRRVLGHLPDAGRSGRVHGRRPPLRHRQLRPHAARAHDVHQPRPGLGVRDPAGGLLRPLHVRQPRPAERGLPGALPVHPRGARSTTPASPSWCWCSSPASPAWPPWRGAYPGGKASPCGTWSGAAPRWSGRSGRYGSRSGSSRSDSAATGSTARRSRRFSPGTGAAGSSTRPPCGASSACWPPRSSTTAWRWSASRRRGRRCRSGIPYGCSARWPASRSSTAPAC